MRRRDTLLSAFVPANRLAPGRSLRATERSARIVLSDDFIVAFPYRLVAVGRDFPASCRLRRLNTNRMRKPLQVLVRDNNVDQALRVLKKKLQREGVFREMKSRRAYEKPSEKRAREKGEAVRRNRKAARKLAQREGLLPGRASARRSAAAADRMICRRLRIACDPRRRILSDCP
jgi:small subunit ribosomal protein S21